MTKEEFIAQLERGATTLADLPVSSAALRFLAEDLKRGKPEWWDLTAKAWQHRRFQGWAEAWSLFFTVLHYHALGDRANPMVPYFPSCGGSADVEPARGIVKFLTDAPDSFYDLLKTGERRAFFGPHGAAWAPLAGVFFQLRSLPFYLVEIGTGGGINLAADLWSPYKLMPEAVAARIGLDAPARSLEDINDRRWLTASLLPDQAALIKSFDQAADLVLDGKRRDPNFVQLVDCAAEKAPKFIAKNIPADDPDVGLLIFNVSTTARMSDEEYAAYAGGMAQILQAWGERALWIEVERVRGEMYATTYETRASRVVGGAPQTLVCGRMDSATGKLENYLEPAVRFLVPPGSKMTADEFLKSLPKPAPRKQQPA